MEKFQSLPGSSACEQLLFSLSQGLFAFSGSHVFPQLCEQQTPAAAHVTHRIHSWLSGQSSPKLWAFQGDLGHFLLCEECLSVGEQFQAGE